MQGHRRERHDELVETCLRLLGQRLCLIGTKNQRILRLYLTSHVQRMLVYTVFVLSPSHIMLNCQNCCVWKRDVNHNPLKYVQWSDFEEWIVSIIFDALIAPREHRLQLSHTVLQAVVAGKRDGHLGARIVREVIIVNWALSLALTSACLQLQAEVDGFLFAADILNYSRILADDFLFFFSIWKLNEVFA